MAERPQATLSRQPSTSDGPRPQLRPASSSYGAGTQTQYTTSTRRHSLYGTEDRIIIDPGSKYWKVGFSGEGKPRQVYLVGRGGEGGEEGSSLWNWETVKTSEEHEEAERMLSTRLQDALRSVFFDVLMTDPKSRKVIIVEHPLLQLRVKDLMARILFDNLNIPSLSFASSHMLSLFAAGRTSGLVLDCGHLETTVLPIWCSRPMYPLIQTTPLAGARLTAHLKELLLECGTYHAPFATLAGAVSSAPRPTRIPPEILTDALIEEIKTSCCFVGGPVDRSLPLSHMPPLDTVMASPSDDRMSVDFENLTPHSRLRVETPTTPRSGLNSGTQSGMQTPLRPSQQPSVQSAWTSRYQRQSTATDFMIPINPPPPLSGTGRGSIRVPGWVRERAAEQLFEGGDVDEYSVVEVILKTLLKTPVDLRKSLISSILIVGGTAMMPGFIPRVHQEIVRTLSRPNPTPSMRSPKRRVYDPFEPLRSLVDSVAILNNPSPSAAPSSEARNGGTAPAFSPLCMPWVGGSLAGALKTGGEEILHDKWDEGSIGDPDASFSGIVVRESTMVLPDWTRVPMSVGAPHAGIHPPRQYGISVEEQAARTT
ncbi:hypothetical protein FRC19_008983 [Serendipita sp. 401]|nr:hypothetical protein FRC19_008983 [Serendipita sp. 401]